ncbi:hypothetical protein RFI_39614, partial [Reticulomyxa filosa]
FRTLFVHFAVDVNDHQLSQLAHNFNDSKNVQIEQKDNSNGNQRIVKQPRCDIYRKSFAAEQKKKREEAVINPEINRYVLLRGVSIHESENKIKETLEDYGYQIQEVKRFHKMHIVKVMLSNSSDV